MDSDLADGCTVEKIRCRNPVNNCRVNFYREIGFGLSLPGSARNIPTVGYTNRDFSANMAIWELFKDYKWSDPKSLN